MITITIYMVDGRTFHYKVDDEVKAREHAHRIINHGWRNIVNGIMEYYAIHQVLKVTFPMKKKDYMAETYEGVAGK